MNDNKYVQGYLMGEYTLEDIEDMLKVCDDVSEINKLDIAYSIAVNDDAQHKLNLENPYYRRAIEENIPYERIALWCFDYPQDIDMIKCAYELRRDETITDMYREYVKRE